MFNFKPITISERVANRTLSASAKINTVLTTMSHYLSKLLHPSNTSFKMTTGITPFNSSPNGAHPAVQPPLPSFVSSPGTSPPPPSACCTKFPSIVRVMTASSSTRPLGQNESPNSRTDGRFSGRFSGRASGRRAGGRAGGRYRGESLARAGGGRARVQARGTPAPDGGSFVRRPGGGPVGQPLQHSAGRRGRHERWRPGIVRTGRHCQDRSGTVRTDTIRK